MKQMFKFIKNIKKERKYTPYFEEGGGRCDRIVFLGIMVVDFYVFFQFLGKYIAFFPKYFFLISKIPNYFINIYFKVLKVY